MIKARFESNLLDGDKPFYIVFNADEDGLILADTGWKVATFQDGKWVEVDEPTLLHPIEWKSATKKQIMEITGGVMPDVDPALLDLDFYSEN